MIIQFSYVLSFLSMVKANLSQSKEDPILLNCSKILFPCLFEEFYNQKKIIVITYPSIPRLFPEMRLV